VRLRSWWLRESDASEPADLRSSIARLHSPDLSLEEELARALRAKRSGARDARPMFDAVANRAATAGFISLSRRARALAQ
jgi:hypothetical protein